MTATDPELRERRAQVVRDHMEVERISFDAGTILAQLGISL